MAVFAFAAAGVVTILAVVLIVLVLVVYLVAIILQLRSITAGLSEVMTGVSELVDKSAPVNGVVNTINEQLDTGVDLLEGLLVRKAGMQDALGLVDGLYPGSATTGFRKFPASLSGRPPRIGEVYTRGTLTLARLGREAPIAAASPSGAALRNAEYGSAAAARLYPEPRQSRPPSLPRSPVVGTGAPIQYTGPPIQHGPRPPDAISWGRTAPEPEPAVPEAQVPAPPATEPRAPASGAPAAPDAPRVISWKRG